MGFDPEHDAAQAGLYMALVLGLGRGGCEDLRDLAAESLSCSAVVS